jgi:multidrug efflux pump subunit AcrA (membrane-fusion protein)
MKPLLTAAAASLLAGCSTLPPPPVTGRDPADPTVPVSRARYSPVTAGTADYRPVAPKPWTERNSGVAPKSSGGM